MRAHARAPPAHSSHCRSPSSPPPLTIRQRDAKLDLRQIVLETVHSLVNSGSATRGAAVGILEIDDDACRQFEQLLRLSMWCLLLRSDHGWVWELEYDLLGEQKASRRRVNAPHLTRPGGVSRLDCVGGRGQQLATRSLADASDDAEAVLFPSPAPSCGSGAVKADADMEPRSAEELIAEDAARRERFHGHRLRAILARRLRLGALRERITSLWESILPLWVDCMAHPASSEADDAPTIAALRLPASRKAAKNLVAYVAEVPDPGHRDAAANATAPANQSERSDVAASTAALFAELEYLALCAIASACPQSWFALLGIDASLNPELQDATPPSALIASRTPLAAVPISTWEEKNDGVERFVLTRAHVQVRCTFVCSSFLLCSLLLFAPLLFCFAHLFFSIHIVQGAAIPPLGHGHGLSTRRCAFLWCARVHPLFLTHRSFFSLLLDAQCRVDQRRAAPDAARLDVEAHAGGRRGGGGLAPAVVHHRSRATICVPTRHVQRPSDPH